MESASISQNIDSLGRGQTACKESMKWDGKMNLTVS